MQKSPKEARAAVDAGALLLDVREPGEWELVHVDGAVLIPMNTIPQRIEELPTDREICVLCHHGGRSAQVTSYLRAHGLNAVNVSTGIEGWAVTVDPSLTRY